MNAAEHLQSDGALAARLLAVLLWKLGKNVVHLITPDDIERFRDDGALSLVTQFSVDGCELSVVDRRTADVLKENHKGEHSERTL